MARPVHFEIPAVDMQRACDFYSAVFGWVFEDWSQFYDRPYVGIITGREGEPGINGAIIKGEALIEHGVGVALTITVDDVEQAGASVLNAGGTLCGDPYPLPGVAWQIRCEDTEGNPFVLHAPDQSAG